MFSNLRVDSNEQIHTQLRFVHGNEDKRKINGTCMKTSRTCYQFVEERMKNANSLRMHDVD